MYIYLITEGLKNYVYTSNKELNRGTLLEQCTTKKQADFWAKKLGATKITKLPPKKK